MKIGDKVYWIDIVKDCAVEYTVWDVGGSYISIYSKNGEKHKYLFKSEISPVNSDDVLNYMYFLSEFDALYVLAMTREEKLDELRDYYQAEGEWDSLRDLEKELRDVLEDKIEYLCTENQKLHAEIAKFSA